jgi:hypothetical protein
MRGWGREKNILYPRRIIKTGFSGAEKQHYPIGQVFESRFAEGKGVSPGEQTEIRKKFCAVAEEEATCRGKICVKKIV